MVLVFFGTIGSLNIMKPFRTLARCLLTGLKEWIAKYKYFTVNQIRVKTISNALMKSTGINAIVKECITEPTAKTLIHASCVLVKTAPTALLPGLAPAPNPGVF